ncbi:hypothetical protein EV363DRAFT_1348921 [Boletus edulis]|nr:hypothetical protein EV363DRAFT_1348921 [Boletus edulis]
MRSCRLPYSYPSCATFNVLLALLNGVARLACRRTKLAELIAPIQKPTLARMAMSAGLFAANILCSTHTRQHGCKRGTLPFFSLGQ